MPSDPITIASLEQADYDAAQRFKARIERDIAEERASWGYPPARTYQPDLTGCELDDAGNLVYPVDEDTDEVPMVLVPAVRHR